MLLAEGFVAVFAFGIEGRFCSTLGALDHGITGSLVSYDSRAV